MAGRRQKRYAGGCLCGRLRFAATGPVAFPHTCSCSMCRRQTGALTAPWVVFAKDRVAWTGPGGAPALWRASAASSRAFCPVCGSAIGAVDDGPTVGLLLGAFDRPGAAELRPTSHSHRSGRPRWWRLETPAPGT